MVDGAPGALGEYVMNGQEEDTDTDPATIQGLEMGVPDVQDQIIFPKTVGPDLYKEF